MWDLNDYIKTWLRSHRCANNMHICTASQKSAVKQEYPVQTFLQANAHFIRTVWCSLPLYLVWERRSHTFSLVLHSWTWPLQPIMLKWRQNGPSTGIASWSRIDTTAVVLKLFLIAYHLWLPYCYHVPPCSRKSQCAKYHSIKSLENQNWLKCNVKKMAVRNFNCYF